jgi:hypothetical protein
MSVFNAPWLMELFALPGNQSRIMEEEKAWQAQVE